MGVSRTVGAGFLCIVSENDFRRLIHMSQCQARERCYLQEVGNVLCCVRESAQWDRRLNQVMEKMQKLEAKDQSTLARILFGLESPSSVPADQEAIERDIGLDDFIDQTLNDSQQDAVRFALCSREVALIHGPPGVSLPIVCIF